MLNSPAIDVAIGLISVYLMLSLMGSAMNEWAARALKQRARALENAIRGLLGEPGPAGLPSLVAGFYAHPMVQHLRGGGHDKGDHPSYLPARTFALALLDLIAPADGHPKTLYALRDKVRELPFPRVRQNLLVIIEHSQGDLDKARAGIERWFDDSMDRLSGVYKRHAHISLFIIGSVLALVTNADTVSMASRLQHEAALREAVVAATARQLAEGKPPEKAQPASASDGAGDQDPSAKPAPETADANAFAANERHLDQLNIAFWDLQHRGSPCGLPARGETTLHWIRWVLLKLLGLLLTGLAISMGAPFWFDLLNRLGSLRSTGARPERETPSQTPAPRPRAMP